MSTRDLYNLSAQNVYCYTIDKHTQRYPTLHARYITTMPNDIVAEIVAPKNSRTRRPEKLLILCNSVAHKGLTSAVCIEYPPKFNEDGSCVSYTMPDRRGTKVGKLLPSTYFTDLGLFEPFASAEPLTTKTDPYEALYIVS